MIGKFGANGAVEVIVTEGGSAYVLNGTGSSRGGVRRSVVVRLTGLGRLILAAGAAWLALQAGPALIKGEVRMVVSVTLEAAGEARVGGGRLYGVLAAHVPAEGIADLYQSGPTRAGVQFPRPTFSKTSIFNAGC